MVLVVHLVATPVLQQIAVLCLKSKNSKVVILWLVLHLNVSPFVFIDAVQISDNFGSDHTAEAEG